MGGVRNVSSHLSRTAGRSSLRTARLSKEDAADKPKRHQAGARAARSVAARSAIAEPLQIEESESLWEDLGFSPEEATNLEIRAHLMGQIREIVRKAGWKQAEAAERCGISQPRINDLLRGKISKFSIEALIKISTALGRRVVIKVVPA